jgi:glucosamine--fructose-6-phosphate aminotransferase (isomerizing)
MIICGQAIAAVIAGNADYLTQLKRLSAVGPRIVEEAWGVSRRLVETEEITKFAFVGNGAFIGLAKECQLKLKEMVLLPSDAYPMFDYRHGPKSNVDEHMLLTMLISDRARAEEIVFLRDMKDLNGTLLVLCDQADEVIRQLADYVVEVRSDLPDFARDVLYMPMIHCLAYYTALARGYDPDNPVNLTYWVELA